MTCNRPLFVFLLLICVAGYVAEGVGYERLSARCHDSRHLGDPERGQEVLPVLGIVLWPILLPFSPPSCDPGSR